MGIIPKLTAFLVVVTLSSSSVVHSPGTKDGVFELLILHNNDMHARFEQTSQLSGTCTTADRELGKCYGGFPRVAHVVKEARRVAASGQGPPVLYLNAGDTYTGTAWFTIYKWKIAAEFLNALQPDAVCLGNHEFDDGVAGLVPFIRNLSSPVLASNLILDDVPDLENEPNLYKSIILKAGNSKIGVIGYLTPDTAFLAPKNKVKYEDEIIAIKREVINLKKQGIDILIALGHSGYLKDKEIAEHVDGLDLVIGGHTNTFLWNSDTNEKPEVVEARYPALVIQPNGRKVLVVQAYAFTKYLGRLHLIFDSNGEITEYEGEPILLQQEIPEDPDVMNVVERNRKAIDVIYNEVVGESLVLLNGDCRLYECNIGNLITDSMINYTKTHYTEFAEVNIAIIQGGRIRTSIDHPTKPFKVTKGSLLDVLPYSDNLNIVTMNGTVLKHTLEHSVAGWSTTDKKGQFLQMSGMEVSYDLAKPPGSRVVHVTAICSKCGDNTLVEVKDYYEYKVLMPLFLADGGDNFTMFFNLPKETTTFNEFDTMVDYAEKYSPVNPNVTGRITILKSEINYQKFSASNASEKIHICYTMLYLIMLIVTKYP